MTLVTAIAKNVKVSPKKTRFLADQIRKMDPAQALAILDFTVKSSSHPLKKAIASAVANAKNNLGLDEASLKFKTISIEEGPVVKRFRAVSRGRAHAILKRSSHIKITLEGDVMKKEAPKAIEAKKEEIKEDKNGTKS